MSIHARTDVNVLRAQSSGRRTVLGVLLGGLVCLGVGIPYAAQGQPVTFNNASLQGTYAYVDKLESVASVGLIAFDGNGGTTAQIKVSQPDTSTGNRTTSLMHGSGTYTVDPEGTGVATIKFDSEPNPTIFDFVITSKVISGRQPVAVEVSAVSPTEASSGELVAPSWKRISN